MTAKSDRLRKLESELQDLQQWLKLGLVPKKDESRHIEEIQQLELRIDEEKERLQAIKDNDQNEEYIAPKRQAARAAYADNPTLPDVDMMDEGSQISDMGYDLETDAMDLDSSYTDERDLDTKITGMTDIDDNDDDDDKTSDDERDDPYSDRNRWIRGFRDPDADEW